MSKEMREAFQGVLHNNVHDPNSANRPNSNPRWIYEDHPRGDLSKESFPRLSLEFIGAPNFFTGYYDSSRNVAISMSRVVINIWAYPDHECTYDVGQDPTGTFKNAELRDRIASEVKAKLESKSEAFKEAGVVITPNTITDPIDRDEIDNNSATTMFHSEVRCEVLYSDVRSTS